MVDRKEYIDKISTQLKEWDSEIENIELKAKNSADNTKIKFDNGISEIKRQKNEFENKLTELKESTGDAWLEIKNGLEKIELDLRETYDRTKQKFSS
jgi:hypothetical protein